MKLFKNEYDIDRTEVLWKPLTVKLTDLRGDSLFYFQMYFLPEPDFLENASYYEKVEYVVKCMRIYRDSTEDSSNNEIAEMARKKAKIAACVKFVV